MNGMQIKNIYDNIPIKQDAEIFEDIINNSDFKLERIISTGQSTPEGEWYYQEKDEWIILLSGSACLTFEDDIIDYELKPGDYILIPARKRHRVKWTNPEEKTVWLALHY